MRAAILQWDYKYPIRRYGAENAPSEPSTTHQIEVIGRIETVFFNTQISGKPTHVLLDY
jgi:hypothetical protein